MNKIFLPHITLLILLINGCINNNQNNINNDSKGLSESKKDSCIQIDISNFIKSSTKIKYSITEKADYGAPDFELVNEFFKYYSWDNLDLVKSKITLEKISNINTRGNGGKTVLSVLVRRPNLELLNLALSKGASVDLLWQYNPILNNIIDSFFSTKDSLLFQTPIVKDLVYSENVSKDVLYEAYEQARFFDVIYIEEIIKSRYNNLGTDSSIVFEINYEKLENLSVLINSSHSRVLSKGVYAFGTCPIDGNIYSQVHNLKRGFSLYTAIDKEKYFISENTFLTSINEIDASSIFLLWKKEKDKIKLLSTLNKKFNPGKYGKVLIEGLFNVNDNKYVVVFKTSSSTIGYAYKKYEFGIWELPNKVSILKTVECISSDETKEHLDWNFLVGSNLLTLNKYKQVKDKSDSLVYNQVIEIKQIIN